VLAGERDFLVEKLASFARGAAESIAEFQSHR
jgi:hypothetical protein